MPLVTLREVLRHAHQHAYAVPSVSVYDLATALNVLKAAGDANSPVIVQMYTRSFETNIGEATFAGVRAVADQIAVPFALHLDHGASFAMASRAFRSGATSVMIDASSLPDPQNIAVTQSVVEMCRAVGVSVEAELGHVGSADDENSGSAYTDPDAAEEFVRQTEVDALAIMVGTAHGIYRRMPVIDIERIAQISRRVGIPLVLHGGSGVPDDQIAAAVKAGIRKVNYATELNLQFYQVVKSRPFDQPIWKRPLDIFMREPLAAAAEFLRNRFELLGCIGQAEAALTAILTARIKGE